jgi:hypothetical protein
MVDQWYWPEDWTSPAAQNIHSERFKENRPREIGVDLNSNASHCQTCHRKLYIEYDVEKYTIRWEEVEWVFSGKGERVVHSRKNWIVWYAAKQLRARWNKKCQNSRIDIFKINGEHERTFEYGNRA